MATHAPCQRDRHARPPLASSLAMTSIIMLKIVSLKEFFPFSIFAACCLLFIGCCLLAIGEARAQLQIPSFLQGEGATQKNFVSPVTSDDLALSWSTNTYTPFIYQGKPLPTYDSAIRVSLIPLKQPKINLNNLIYKWYLDDVFQKYASGENRQDFMFRPNSVAGTRAFVDLQIEDQEGNIYLKISTNLPIVAPEVVLYPADGSTDERSLGAPNTAEISPGQEQNFVALPFFFNISKASDLEYQWTFNGQTITKIDKPNQFSLKVAEGELQESFTRELSVFTENPRNRIQTANGKIEIVIKK